MLACNRDGAAMNFNKLTGNRQPYSASLIHHTFGKIVLEESFKNFLLLIPRDADAVVFHIDLDPFDAFGSLNPYVNRNCSVLRGKLKCIGKKIKQNLFELILVEKCFQLLNGGMKCEFYVFLFREIGKRIEDFPYELYNVTFRGVVFDLLHFHFSEIEQLIDQVQ